MAQKSSHICLSQNSWQLHFCPGLGGTGRASKSLRRSTAAPEECGLGDVGAVVGGGVCNHRFPHDFRAADLPISDSKDSFIYQKWIAWDFLTNPRLKMP